ncbi:hypothetical protein L6452_06261 [Arctium lappa]|uniref:Uncharacterized protein n=1 Tax=Arctium lappa TaxID=4217 RepID=A0ACB9EJ40_ARCLA|nr:hypothetical protein L6452_06261 [Arctium lappa]
MCLMGKQAKYDESDGDTSNEVTDLSETDFLKQMNSMMVELQDLQSKMKREKGVVEKNESQSLDDEDLFDEVDFLNSEECSDECMDKFDFNAKFTDHTNFVINYEELASVFEVGESESKVDEPIPVSAYYVEGCSKHMTGRKDILSNYIEKFCSNVRFGNDHFSPILGHGDVVQENVMIKKVIYVEGLRHNLFSIRQFCDKDLEVNFKAKRCCVRTDKELLVKTRKSNLYTINLSNLVKGNLVKRLPELKYEKEHLCDVCEKDKMKRASHKSKPEQNTNDPLELLHMDLCGPMRTQSINGKRYVLVIMDDFSRYTWVKFLRSKDETPDIIIFFLKSIQVNLQRTVKFIRTDNGTEFKNKTIEDYLEYVGITHQYSAARTTKQNEFKNVITVSLASGQISPEPGSNVSSSDKASTSTSHLSELDLLFEHFYDEFLGSKVSRPVVIDSFEESSEHQTITSDVSTELVTPVQTETQLVEDAQNDDQTEDVQQDDGYLDDQNDQSTHTPPPHTNKWTKEHLMHQIIGNPSKPVQTRSATTNECLYDSFLSKIEPNHVSEALKDPDWIAAMQEELNQFEELKVWRLVPKPEGKTIFGTKWVFKNKKDEDSVVVRNKARLVAKG